MLNFVNAFSTMRSLVVNIFFIYFLLSGHCAVAQLVMNEICTYNDDVLEDMEGDKSDWIELYNAGNSSINLSGFSVSSKKQQLSYALPSISVNAHAFAIVFISGKNKNIPQIHTNFKIQINDTITLHENQQVTDQLIVPDLFVDHSYGAVSDGSAYKEIFTTPTPGTSNNASAHFEAYAPAPEFSLESGFFTGTQILTLSATAPNAIIFYRVDGNSPNTSSAVYSTPIVLNKTTIVKAFTVVPGMPSSKIKSKTFFIDEAFDLPVIAISTDSLLLYDTISGLLQPGPNADPYPPFYGANFWADTQIEVHLQVFDKYKKEQLNQQCELQIHGGSMNRSQAMKSFRLLSKKKFEQDRFYARLIEDKPINAYRKFVLRNGSSDFLKSQVREGLIHKTLIKNTHNDANGYEPCIVFINGKYYGLMEIREKIDEYYAEQNHGVDKDNVDVLADTNLVDIGDWVAFDSVYRYVLHHDMKQQEYFNYVADRIDLNNMADYFITETYFDNNDWPSGNLRLWHERVPNGKFRYIIFDLDASLGTFTWSPYTLNMLHESLNYFTTEVPNKHCIIFKKLLENETFKKYFINRYADLFNSAFSSGYLLSMLDTVKSNINTSIERHYTKWGKTYGEWDAEINNIIVPYIKNRHAQSKEDLLLEFDYPAYHHIAIAALPADAFKELSINTIQVLENNFEGYYFQTVPIRFNINPKEGYIFSHWLHSNGTKYFTDTLTIDLHEHAEFTAIYFSESQKNDIVVYPNPNSKNKLYVRIPQEIDQLKNVSIVNLLGETIYASSQPDRLGEFTLELNTDQLPQGIYFIKLEINNKIETIKFTVL